VIWCFHTRGVTYSMQVVSTSQCRVRRQANKRRYIYPYTHWSCPLRVIWRFHIFGANYSKQVVSKWQYRVMTHAWISWREQVNLYDFNDFLSWREENSWISWREQVDFSQINLLQRVVPSYKKIRTVCQKPRIVTKCKSMTLWNFKHHKMSQNVTRF